MGPISVRCEDCPVPVREALAHELSTSGIGEMIDHEDHDDRSTVVVMVFARLSDDSGAVWRRLESLNQRGATVVVLLEALQVDQYARALALGAAGVVHYDTSASVIASVLEAASRSEVVLPKFAAHALAGYWTDTPVPKDLTARDCELLRALLTGERMNDIAMRLSFSDRTVRRHLQSLYLKIGAGNRYEAVQIASRLPL